MGEHTEYLRKISQSVADTKRVKQEIKSICDDIEILVKKAKVPKHRKHKQRK